MKRMMILIALLISSIAARNVLAQDQPQVTYDLSWYTIDNGGGSIGGGSYSLDGTIGQPEAGQVSSLSYTLVSGFWGRTVATYRNFLPLVLKT
jgi:hypothetical protein